MRNIIHLSGDDGTLNAFEEYAVRELTTQILLERYPESIESFLWQLGKNERQAPSSTPTCVT